MLFKPRTGTHYCNHSRRSFIHGLASIIACIAMATSSMAAEPSGADQSSDAARSEAFRRIPLQSMTAEAQAKISGVVKGATYFRRMPQRTIECDQELFKQFVRYPEILIGVWDAMGATKVQVERVAPYIFRADDGAGTQCNCELLYGNETVHVYYSTGDYTGKLVPKRIDGRSVCVVHSSTRVTADGRSTVTAQLDVFLKLDSLGADLVVRTIGPLMGATADQNYFETLKFVSQLSSASTDNPFGVRGLIERVRYVQAPVKEKFIGEVYLAADRASRFASKEANEPTQR